MVAYIAGSCSQAEKVDFESHCLSCDECLATLAIVLRLLHFPSARKKRRRWPYFIQSAWKPQESPSGQE